MSLSDNNRLVLRYFWTSRTSDEADLMVSAVTAGVNPDRFVYQTIDAMLDIGTPEAKEQAENMRNNFDEACDVVRRVLGFPARSIE